MILKMKYYSGRQVHNIITETIAGKTLADVLERFAKEPSADVQEIRRGRWLPDEWITDREGVLRLVVKCSICGGQVDGLVDYCPYCGATMEEEEEA